MARDFCLPQSVQTDSEAHPVSYSLGTRASFPRVTAVRAILRMSGSILPLPHILSWCAQGKFCIGFTRVSSKKKRLESGADHSLHFSTEVEAHTTFFPPLRVYYSVLDSEIALYIQHTCFNYISIINYLTGVKQFLHCDNKMNSLEYTSVSPWLWNKPWCDKCLQARHSAHNLVIEHLT
jgi:hypothetical protein